VQTIPLLRTFSFILCMLGLACGGQRSPTASALDESCTGKVDEALERKVAALPDVAVYSVDVAFGSEVTDADATALGLMSANSLAATGEVSRGKLVALCKDARVKTLKLSAEVLPVG
jgi:hypothetical protein